MKRLKLSAPRKRFLLIILVELSLVVLSNLLAFELRFDGQPPDWARSVFLKTVPVLLLVRAVTFVPFHLYDGLWRYFSIWDLRNIVLGVVTGTAIFGALMHTPFGPRVYPHSVLIADALVLIILLAGLRLFTRVLRDLAAADGDKRVLVYGAGDAGELIVNDMKHNSSLADYEPVGFVDDDPAKKGLRIHGVPVLGSREDLPWIIEKLKPQEILIAMPNADAASIRKIISALEPFKVSIKTLPNLSDLLDGRVSVSQIRSLETEDLLNRAPIDLDNEAVRRLIRGRRVMVTGAGGSIGSELCRQIAALSPACLVLFERYENSLFAIENDLADRKLGRGVVAEIGDVTDPQRLNQVLTQYRPEIVFHAAAHKHVPLMEQSPPEAVKNNISGTRILAEMADRHGVDRFVFISTDKAVNPTSVMGTTKRISELLVQAQAQGSGTSFFTVRFGNVLGSNGSVVPRFMEQIKAGGPVTVTHPEMRRFFMLIPEAVQLVLQAAAHGKSGATYVLEMGEQVKVLDMARNLIRLAGYVPEEEIQIRFVGLRPGEKLFEELIGEDEVVVPSNIEKVVEVRARRVPTPESLRAEVGQLEDLAWEGRRRDVLRQLARLVPEYAPNAAIETVRSGLTYVRTEADPEPETEPALPSVRACPTCGGARVHRSHARSLAERVKKSMTADRLFRCHDCGWRGWLEVIGEPEHATELIDTTDLAVLDSRLERNEAPRRSAFSPRNLK
jgi:FlaA1/EpsC-like NDP-sugar epimerase